MFSPTKFSILKLINNPRCTLRCLNNEIIGIAEKIFVNMLGIATDE